MVFTLRTVEVYRLLRLRCPRLTVQPFVKFLFDLNCQPLKPYLYQQFSIAFDVYIEIRQNVRGKVLKMLNRSDPLWRVKQGCTACSYRLKGEPTLRFSRLLTFDGNDSAKRILRRTKGDGEDTGRVAERLDGRNGGGDYFLPRDAVNKWAKENIEVLLQPVSLQTLHPMGL